MKHFMNIKKLLFFLILLVSTLFSQDTILFMSYNLLSYPGTDASSRNNYYKTITQAVKPDILVVQEITSQIGVDGFLVNVLRTFSQNYNKGAYLDGPDSDNAIFYDSTKFDYLSNTAYATELRDINLFQVRHKITLDTLFIFSVHLKASTGAANEAQRGREVDVLRGVTNNWPAGRNFLVCGDFNIYGTAEVAYQKLRATVSGTQGHFIDPIVMSGTFNQSQYAIHHTQSPRTRQFGGGSTGGMDDRFDMILFSQAISDSGGIEYVRNSNTAYGNDGQHYNDSINRPPNSAVGQTIADALHYASDHIPVYQKLIFKQSPILPVEFASFSVTTLNNTAIVTWRTASETNNMGFEVERKVDSSEYSTIAFVPGIGTSSYSNNYSFKDGSLQPGRYIYRLKQIDFNGVFSFSKEVEVIVSSLNSFSVDSNYPNPFNPSTTIAWNLPSTGMVKLSFYNALGQLVSTESMGMTAAGKGSYIWDASGLSSGIYFARVEFLSETGSYSQFVKLNLMK